jgi:hypothetical protein
MSCAPDTEMRPFAVKNALVVGADLQIETLVLSVLKPSSWVVLRVPDNLADFDLTVTSDTTSGREHIELLRQIRRVRPHIRLIILAGESTPADVITSMRERAFSYFSKPLDWRIRSWEGLRGIECVFVAYRCFWRPHREHYFWAGPGRGRVWRHGPSQVLLSIGARLLSAKARALFHKQSATGR